MSPLVVSLPLYVVHDAGGSIRAARIPFAEDAAAFASIIGEGATVRAQGAPCRGRILWTEGPDGSAHDSYDEAGEVIRGRAVLP